MKIIVKRIDLEIIILRGVNQINTNMDLSYMNSRFEHLDVYI